MLREKYGKQNTIFDLAYYESNNSNSKHLYVNRRSNDFLLPIYTYDGGHLNDIGKVTVAKQLLLFLVSEPILQ